MTTKLRALVAGNWKMNQGTESGLELARAIVQGAARAPNADLVVAPPFTLLGKAADVLAGSAVELSGQNMHQAQSGAFTGEISAEMLKATGCRWVILGHSERRQFFGETDESVAEKTKAALAAGLRPIVCVGETLSEREAGATFSVVGRQLAAFEALLAAQPGVAAIAYEPVWAIGTGKVATTEQAQEVHAAIRAQLGRCSAALAEKTRILYGGSVKPDNAKALLACTDIDGALVGGASLKAEDFLQIAAGAG
jgi:triosephosphate isomerase (TIM)